jgi:two-component system, NtrC family, response regulator AtoC
VIFQRRIHSLAGADTPTACFDFDSPSASAAAANALGPATIPPRHTPQPDPHPSPYSMPPSVAVHALSDSFSEVWPRLVRAVGAEVAAPDDPASADGARPVAVIVAAAGCESDALPVLEALRRDGGPPAAVVGAESDYALVRGLLRAGAAEYFAFPAEVGGLRTWLADRVADAADAARRDAREEARHGAFGRLVGASRPLREVLASAEMMSGSGSSTVLILGETGTGKDVLAQAIHERSPRAAGRFVEVNCAALPANLLEAELFGYEKGAFTDARSAKMGLVETAEGGTLFLDEIGDLPVELQGKLLRVLETKRTRRLGGLRDVQVDVRVIAATHVDLAQRVRERRFREDLFYRLDVLSLTLPPLRERDGDVELLANHFAEEFGRTYGVPVQPLSAEVRAAMREYAWPGNVRQLRNAVERAVILGRGAITVENLRIGGGGPPSTTPGVLPFPATLEAIQAAAAQAAVAACVGNKSRAADLLGISRKGLYALLRSGGAEEAS